MGISAVSLVYLLLLYSFYRIDKIKAYLSALKDNFYLFFQLNVNKIVKPWDSRQKFLAC